jgi:hypothetical protein
MIIMLAISEIRTMFAFRKFLMGSKSSPADKPGNRAVLRSKE